jgi:hypothetical protein
VRPPSSFATEILLAPLLVAPSLASDPTIDLRRGRQTEGTRARRAARFLRDRWQVIRQRDQALSEFTFSQLRDPTCAAVERSESLDDVEHNATLIM